MNIDTSQAHNALGDIVILDKVLENFNITNDTLINHVVTLVGIEKKELFAKELPGALKELSAPNKCTSLAMRKRIVAAGISYTNILETYEEEKLIGLQKLFGEDESGTARVTVKKKVVRKIYDLFEKDSTPAMQNN